MTKIFGVGVLGVCLLLVIMATPAWSQPAAPSFNKTGGYAAVSFLPDFKFDGVTFDGESIYKEIDGDEITILPRLNSRPMVRAALGYRGRVAAIEFSYDRTHHDGVFLGETGDAVFQAVNVDGRYFFLPGLRVQPYIAVGGTMPFFNVKKGSFLNDAVADARFKGYGASAEGGITVYPHRQLGISVGYNYRVLSFDQVSGVNDKLFDLKPRFRENSKTIVVSTHMIF